MRLKTMLTPKSGFFFHSTRSLLPVLISLTANKLVEFKGIVTNGVSEYNISKASGIRFLSLFQLKL